MPQTLGGVDANRLERSCSLRSDSIRFGPSAQGVERADVDLSTCAFEPHRHDTYAIGITTAGVQVFHYRGSRRVCLPGQLHVLHPDELHDGGYRTLRRLALARTAIESGQSLARAAAETGFADQSHMTRQFKRTYGLTPARWVALIAASSPETSAAPSSQ
jgi:AraC-like DNA-binding protein